MALSIRDRDAKLKASQRGFLYWLSGLTGRAAVKAERRRIITLLFNKSEEIRHETVHAVKKPGIRDPRLALIDEIMEIVRDPDWPDYY